MKALYLHAAQDLRLGECELPAPGPGEVALKMARGGICGSDLHYFQHGGFGTVRVREPIILGHEVAGHVSAVGEGVERLEIGDLVAVSPSRPCASCGECLRGLPQHCLNMRFYGSAMPFPHIQGAFREGLIAQAAQCVPADGLSAGEAAMAEPLAVCLHGVRQAGGLVGRRVLVTGCGPIGVLTILAARRAGAGEIVAIDIAARALGFAETAGADTVLDIAAQPDALAPWSEGKGAFDVLFECSGSEAALASGIPAVRPQGTIVQLGMSGEMRVPMTAITVKELQLRGSFRFHEEFAVAVTMMRKGLIDTGPLLTHSFPLEAYEEAFATASDRSRAMKVQLEFDAC